MKILVVDDSLDFRELMVSFLNREGFETAQAQNGKAALEYLIKNSPPDLILLDSEMDVMNGTELLNELEFHHEELFKNLKIIVLSGVEGFSHSRPFRSLRKPIDLSKLEAAMSQALAV